MLLQVLAARLLHLGVYCSCHSHHSGKCMHISTIIVNNDSLAIPFLNYTGQCWVPNHGSSHNVSTSKETRKGIKERHSKVCTVILSGV